VDTALALMAPLRRLLLQWLKHQWL
jgi:hypothetical protein